MTSIFPTAEAILGANPIMTSVPGAPYQPGDVVVVVDAVDLDVHDVSAHIGKLGRVDYLEYECGSGQHYPDDPMVGVRLGGDDGPVEEFWKEELKLEQRQ